jgi:hypothetical protein
MDCRQRLSGFLTIQAMGDSGMWKQAIGAGLFVALVMAAVLSRLFGAAVAAFGAIIGG